MSKPKPCPFCGWGTIFDGGFLNHKCTCNACGASTKGYPTWELAVEAWNMRTKESYNERNPQRTQGIKPKTVIR